MQKFKATAWIAGAEKKTNKQQRCSLFSWHSTHWCNRQVSCSLVHSCNTRLMQKIIFLLFLSRSDSDFTRANHSIHFFLLIIFSRSSRMWSEWENRNCIKFRCDIEMGCQRSINHKMMNALQVNQMERLTTLCVPRCDWHMNHLEW